MNMIHPFQDCISETQNTRWSQLRAIFLNYSWSVVATQKLVRDEIHIVETVMVYLGLQDATGKRCPKSQTPG